MSTITVPPAVTKSTDWWHICSIFMPFLIAFGVLLPWASVLTVFGSIEVTGMDTDDGFIFLGAAVVLLIFTLFRSYLVAAVFGSIAAAMAIYEAFHILQKRTAVLEETGMNINLGAGLLLIIGATIAYVIFNIVQQINKP